MLNLINKKYFDISIFIFIWIVTISIVNPIGNFPLNDDWSFALTVKHLLDHGYFRPTDWASMTQLTNTLWGSLFCLPLGFSFTTLRISTLTIALLAILCTYKLASELKIPRYIKYIIIFLLAYNPIFHALSYTFMTDVLFTSVLILNTLFFCLYLTKKENIYYIISILICITSVLSRQLALAVPLAFFIIFIVNNNYSLRNFLKAIFPLFITAAVLFLFQEWMKTTGRLPKIYFQQTEYLLLSLKNPLLLVNLLLKNIPIILLYMGLFLFPLILIQIPRIIKYQKISFIFSTILIIFLLLLNQVKLMPLAGNILIPSGIGPLTLTDTYILGQKHVSSLPLFIWILATLLSVIGAIFLLCIITSTIIETIKQKLQNKHLDQDTALKSFLLLVSLIYLFPLAISSFFDRYLIVITPLIAIYIYNKEIETFFDDNKEFKEQISYISYLFIFLFAAFSVLSTKEYLSWNKTRWQIVYDLENIYKIPQDEIDGGFEVNGFYAYNPNYSTEKDNHSPVWIVNGTYQIKSPWWVNKDTYMITFSPLPNYEVVKEYHYQQILPTKLGKLFLLKRTSE